MVFEKNIFYNKIFYFFFILNILFFSNLELIAYFYFLFFIIIFTFIIKDFITSYSIIRVDEFKNNKFYKITKRSRWLLQWSILEIIEEAVKMKKFRYKHPRTFKREMIMRTKSGRRFPPMDGPLFTGWDWDWCYKR